MSILKKNKRTSKGNKDVPENKKEKSNRAIGTKFERFAAKRMKQQGWKIIDTNFTSGHNEIDIIAVKDYTIVFVEVKSEKKDHYDKPMPELRIDADKARCLGEAAKDFVFYMSSFGIDIHQFKYRFDIMTIIYNSDYKPVQCTYYEDFYFHGYLSRL